MFTPLFALLGTWVGIFILLAILAVVWLFMKATADLVIWFREEVLDDPARRKGKDHDRRDPHESVTRSRPTDRGPGSGRRGEL